MRTYYAETDDFKKEMGNRLFTCRSQSKLTQENMAEILGITAKHYGDVERGSKGLSIGRLIFLSNFFCVRIYYLLKGERRNETIPFILMDVYSSCPDEKKGCLLEMFQSLGKLINAESPQK